MAGSEGVRLNRGVITNDLWGRFDIFAGSDEITEENVVYELNTALPYHVRNLLQEDFLYWYRRNVQPILNRTKEVRPEIMNVVQVDIPDSIVTFKNGYFLTQPAFYVGRTDDDGLQDKVKTLNEYLYRSGKQDADNELVDWFHTVGKGVLYVEPDRDNDKEVPVHAYALDPRSAFVVYSMRPGKEPVMGVNFVVVDKVAKFDVYTKKNVFHLTGTSTGTMITNQTPSDFLATAVSVESVEPNPLGLIPIIEYRYNNVNMGSFEAAVPMIDAYNNVVSNRIDGIEQFIQSLAVATNCEFPEGTTANDIRKAGMIILKSVGENKASFQILSEQLDQGQTQVLLDDLYEKILQICAMPSTTKGGTSTSDTGVAVLARDGWYIADTSARNCADLFYKSNRQFDRIFIEILRRRGLLDISLTDFELAIVRNETANIQSKAQAFNTLMSSGLDPELAAEKSGVSNDPNADIKKSEKWIKMRWGDPDAPAPDAMGPQGGGGAGGGQGGPQSAGQQKQGASATGKSADQRGRVWAEGYWQDRQPRG